MISVQEFMDSLSSAVPPQDISEYLKSMWFDANDHWDAAHAIIQELEDTPYGRLIHAYLHRKEGDQWNAQYWYKVAGRDFPSTDIDEEWKLIVMEIISNNTV